MPATYRIIAEVRLVHTETTGVLTGDEMVAHARALRADPAFSPDLAQFADFRGASDIDARHAELQQLALSNPFDRTARRVALVGSPVFFGMLRMYQLMTDTETTGSLVTMSELEAWTHLGHSPVVLAAPAVSHWSSDESDARASG